MRIINFFDGAESETTPVIGNVIASNLVQYADDAEYESNELGAPTTGNLYYNTTLNLIRYYNGTEWISIVDEKTIQTIENKIIDGSSTGNNTVKTIALNVEVTPDGNLTSDNVQDALVELQDDIDALDLRLDNAEVDIIDLQTDKENKSEKGQPNGYAGLDGSGKVPASQLPSYVDDVLEYANLAAFPVTGEIGKIYIALDTNLIYRWTGSTYVEISSVATYGLNDLTDVIITVPSTGEILRYNGTNWVNYNPGTPVTSLDGLTDVDVTTIPPIINDVLTYNGIQWVPLAAGAGSTVPTGLTSDYSGSTAPTGWVLASGLTIGNGSSGATNRANSDTQTLFVLLWNSFSNTELPIQDSTGTNTTRGVNAITDFNANKRLPTPDLRGRVVAGKDDMGGTNVNRLSTILASTTLGGAGGAQTHGLSVNEMPAHKHTSNVPQLGYALQNGNTGDLNATQGGTAGQATIARSNLLNNTGGSAAHNNTQPTFILNKIIKL